ncbi:MAG: polysaccharide pyruvyl transferase CsaB [Chthonomonadales bacterium]
MKNAPTRIVVSGYYGCGNTGDEAVLAGIMESFRQMAGDSSCDFTVLSAKPDETQKLHGTNAVQRMDRAARQHALAGANLFLSGGGSLLQDTTSLRSLLYYLWVIREANARRVPVVYYAHGIGPLKRGVSRFLTKIVTNRAALVTVRDEESAKLLQEIGVNKPRIVVTADPAFVLRPCDAIRTDELLSAAGVAPGEKLIGFAIRTWPGFDGDVWRQVSELIADEGYTPLFIPMQPPGDLELSLAAAGTVGRVVKGTFTASEAIGLISRCDALVAMRLHALIFGAVVSVPLIGAAYDPKVASLMKLLGQNSQCFDLVELSPQRLLGEVRSTLMHATQITDGLSHIAEGLSRRALENASLALAEAK